MLEKRIDALIVAGWCALETDFSEGAFEDWRKQAYECVVALCGQSHPYSGYFRRDVEEARKSSMLTGVGLLTAVRSSVKQDGGGRDAGESMRVELGLTKSLWEPRETKRKRTA